MLRELDFSFAYIDDVCIASVPYGYEPPLDTIDPCDDAGLQDYHFGSASPRLLHNVNRW